MNILNKLISAFIFFSCFFILACVDHSSGPNSEVTQISEDIPSEFKILKMNGLEGWSFDVTSKLYLDLSNEDFLDVYDLILDEQSLIELGCINFNQLSVYEKKLFYIVFLAAIAERESNFNPYDVTKKNIGLLQIDLNSAHRHAGREASHIKSNSDLMVASENLRIGTYILKNQLQGRWIPEVKGRLLTKRNYYWEVLNDEYKGRVIKSFHNNRANLPFCQDY